RFLPAHFDALEAHEAGRWGVLGALALRLFASAPPAPEAQADGTSLRPADKGNGATRLPPNPEAGRSGNSTAVPFVAPRRHFPGIVGKSPSLSRALARLEAAIGSELPVLVVGETGAGKELFARALHDLGPRARRAFVAVNCGAIPDALFEAE